MIDRILPKFFQRPHVHRTTTAVIRLLYFSVALAFCAASPHAQSNDINPDATPSADSHAIAGTWWIKNFDPAYLPVNGEAIPFTTEGRKAYQAALQDIKSGKLKDNAIDYCIPQGVPRILSAPYPLLILQTQGLVTVVHEITHATRLIFMDVTQSEPDDINESFMGHSVGKWDGDTLVIDTLGIKESAWIDGTGMPHSDKLHIVERLHKISQTDKKNMQLEDLITIEDPRMFIKPWTTRRVYEWRPDVRISEYVCGEKNRDISSVKMIKRGVE
jgi:hypothetical protein